MRVVQRCAAMRRLALDWKRAGIRVGCVPTMGYLHAGHVRLIHQARKRVGPDGIVVVSLYVNPTQFGPSEDLSRYPRDLAGDKRQCAASGVDVLFAPDDRQMYPPADDPADAFSTYVDEGVLSKTMEGASRPTHFRGVTTVVAKLFNLVLPDVAVFGAKDWQQAAVIRRMVRDLDFPVRIVVSPTVREKDGLAMSSRNRYLSVEERPQAAVLWRAIQAARTAVRRAPQGVPASILRRRLIHLIHRQPAARVDYLEFFDPARLTPLTRVRRGTHLALAVFVGATRLIDNAGM